jgi:hypothetical protein
LSQFSLFVNYKRGSNLSDDNLLEEDFLSSKSFLSNTSIPHILDFYRLYFFENEKRNLQSIRKMIPIESVVSIGWTSHSEDHLPGYNFYIQTKEKVYIMSSSSALEAYRLVKGLQTAQSYLKELDCFNLRNNFKNAKSLLKCLRKFKTEEFFGVVEKELTVDITQQNFSVGDFENLLLKLKNYIRILKLSENLAPFIQEFLLLLHRSFAISMKHVKPEISELDLAHTFKLFTIYNYKLEEYGIIDQSFKKMVNTINAQMFDILNKKVVMHIVEFLKEYFSDQTHASAFFNKNFYNMIFGILREEIESSQPPMRVNIELIQNTFDFVNVEVFNQVVSNQDVGFLQLIHLINSCCKFNREFFDFVSKIKEKHTDRKFLASMEKCTIVVQVNDLIEIIFSEIQIRFEQIIIEYFNSHTNFESLALNELFSKNFLQNCFRIKKNVLKNLAEILFNNLLSFILRLYFGTFFLRLGDRTIEQSFEKRLEKDEEVLKSFFVQFLELDNMTVQLENFQHLKVLLTSDNYHNLLKASIKFNLFFNNQLEKEIMEIILERNFNLSLDVEEEILSFYSEEQKNKEKSFFFNQSSIQESKVGSQKVIPKKSVSNYLPHIQIRTMSQAKLQAFKAKSRIFMRDEQESVHFSFDCELVNHSVNEDYLENLVKVIFIDSCTFDHDKFSQKLKVD